MELKDNMSSNIIEVENNNLSANVIEVEEHIDYGKNEEYYNTETGKDGITYYDSAVGLDNALKKNSIVYPNKKRTSDKRSVAGSIRFK